MSQKLGIEHAARIAMAGSMADADMRTLVPAPSVRDARERGSVRRTFFALAAGVLVGVAAGAILLLMAARSLAHEALRIMGGL